MKKLLLLAALSTSAAAQSITATELQQRTQRLYDAAAPGNKQPFQQYFASDCIFSDEKGRTFNKQQLLDDIQPLPSGYTGHIRIINAQSVITSTTAVYSYDMDESETVFGQELHARYHVTDTWLLRNHQWQIVASQAMRYYEDPATTPLNPTLLNDYLGTYQLAPGNTVTISLQADQLYYQSNSRPRIPLLPEAPDLFFRKGIEGRIFFRRNSSGKIETLINRRNNEDILWKKIS